MTPPRPMDVGKTPRTDFDRTVPANSANRFAHIDALRAFAVSLVIVQHAGLSIVPGDAGVTVFFSISGFIITFILLRERDKAGGFDLRRFYVRRLLKIAPPFIIAILIPTLIYAFFQPVNGWVVLSQVFFSYNWVQVFANEFSYQVLPGSDVVWSLAVEEQFYIVFALIWIALVRARWWRAALVALSVATIVAANVTRIALFLQGDQIEHMLRGTDARMDAIAWGVLAAVAYHARLEGRALWIDHFSRNWVPVAALVVFLAVFALQSDGGEQLLRQAVHPLCTLAVILYGLRPTGAPGQELFYRLSRWKPVAVVGLASYSIYISHYVLVHPLYYGLEGTVPLGVLAPLLIVVSLAVGLALYYVVEVPVAAWRKRVNL